jgi:hypothetical protein
MAGLARTACGIKQYSKFWDMVEASVNTKWVVGDYFVLGVDDGCILSV